MFYCHIRDTNVIKPITPQELRNTEQALPDYVIEAFNLLIADPHHVDGINRRAGILFSVKDAVDMIILRAKLVGVKLTVNDVFYNMLLNVESHYQQAGWKVVFTKAVGMASRYNMFAFYPL